MTMTTRATPSAQKSAVVPAASISFKLETSLLVRLSNDDLLKHCKGMLEDITANMNTTQRTRLIDKTSRLFDILSDEQQYKHKNRILLDGGGNISIDSDMKSSNNNENDENNTVHKHNRTKKTSKDNLGHTVLHDETKIPTSVIVNHVLPFLDHNTWKSVSILSKDMYETVHHQNLYPPWPTDIINLGKGTFRGTYVEKSNFHDLSFDHDKGNRFVIKKGSFTSGSIYDSKRGFIKNIDFSTVMKRKDKLYKGGIYLLDAKTFILEIGSYDTQTQTQVYLYRMVEEIPYHRKIVGIDIIPFPHEKITGGPWFFKQNGSLYVATAHKSTDTKISDKIIINRYLGEHSWPNCLQETHVLLGPNIEMSTDFRGRVDTIVSRVYQYLCLPSNNEKQNDHDEIMVLVTVTYQNKRYVHYWRLHFDEMGTGSNGTAMNDTIVTTTTTTAATTISPISCGNVQHVHCEPSGMFLPTVKIVASPYGLYKYSIRMIEYWKEWWDGYYDNKEDYFDLDRSIMDENAYIYMVKEYNEPNIVIWDYNIDLNKFEITNEFSLIGQDGSSLQYESLNASNDGQYLLPYSKSEGLGVCRLDNYLKTGSKMVQNRGFFNKNYSGPVCLSNDNILAIEYYKYQPNSNKKTSPYLIKLIRTSELDQEEGSSFLWKMHP